MFKNRSFLVKMIDDKQVDQIETFDTDSTTVSENVRDAATHLRYAATETAEQLAVGAIALTITYLAADTLRQVIIHTAKTKIK